MSWAKALFFLCCVASSAGADPVDNVVRVLSQPRGATKVIETTGTLLRLGGRPFVVASSLGVLEESGASSHRVALREGVTLAARAVKVDWGTGLALLEPETDPGGGIEVETLPEAPPSPLATLHIAGGKISYALRIVQATSTRHSLPLVDTTHETQSDAIAVTEAGAPVFGTSLAGIVSHQHLKLVPGAPSRLAEWKAGEAGTTRRPLLLPIAAVKRWLLSTHAPASFFQQNQWKIDGAAIVRSGKITWRALCPDDEGSEPSGGGPIGGGEGVGVGGEAPGAATCAVTLEAAPASGLSWPFPVLQSWHDGVLVGLGEGRRYEVPSLLSRDDATNRIARNSFRTLAQFFSLLRRPGVTPTLLWKGETVPATQPVLAELKARNTALRARLELRYQVLGKESSEYRKLFRRLYFLTSVLDSTTRWYVTGRDLREAKGQDPDIGIGWILLERNHKEDAAFFGDALLELAKLRDQLGGKP